MRLFPNLPRRFCAVVLICVNLAMGVTTALIASLNGALAEELATPATQIPAPTPAAPPATKPATKPAAKAKNAPKPVAPDSAPANKMSDKNSDANTVKTDNSENQPINPFEANAAINKGVLLATTEPLGSNDESAFYWYLRAANLNSPQGNDFVGNAWRDGRGIRKNLKEAIKYYHLAVKGGNVAAMKSLAEFYENGIGLERHREKAFDLYDRAGKLGDEWAKTRAMLLADITNITPELVTQTLRQANGGDLSSMTRLGALYYYGVGVGLDPSKGNWWLQQTANHGEIRARLYLAEHALAKRDLATALLWFSRAGSMENESEYNTGMAYAQYFTARIMAGEFGAPPDGIDLTQAQLWYVYAARANLSEAMIKLSSLLRDDVNQTAYPAQPRLAYYFALLADRHHTQNAAELRVLSAKSLSQDTQRVIEQATQQWQRGMDFPASP